MARTVTRIARRELRVAGLEAGEVGEQRALDRLEELQRRAGDQQRVEDEAGDGGVRRRRVRGQHGGVDERLLGEHDHQHRHRRSRPPPCRRRSPPPAGSASAAEGERDDDQRDQRRRGHAERDRDLARREPDRDGQREQEPRRRLEEHERRRRARSACARPATRARSTTPRRRRSRRRAPHHSASSPPNTPSVMLVPEDHGDDERGGARSAAWMRSADRVTSRPGGDVARQQLLDRPVDDRHRHEQHRPQQRDALVVDVVEHVRRDGEVREGDDARRARCPIDSSRAPRP